MNTINSITGKALAHVFMVDMMGENWGFLHLATGKEQTGFATWQMARDAFVSFHNEWFETSGSQ